MCDTDPARVDGGGRVWRRQEQHQRRRHRRAAVSDLARTGLDSCQQQELTVGELLSAVAADAAPLSVLALRRIKHGLAAGPAHRKAFSEPSQLPHRLQILLERLTGDDPEEQLEAAACITNLAAGPVSPDTVRRVGGYLVTLAGGGNHLLQEQCIWALGNLACSGAAICSLLASQGMHSAVISCLKSQHEVVRDSAATAGAAFLTHSSDGDARRLAREVVPLSRRLLSLDSEPSCLCVAAAADVCAAEILSETSAETSGSNRSSKDTAEEVDCSDVEMDCVSAPSQSPSGHKREELAQARDTVGATGVEAADSLVSVVGDLLLRGLTDNSHPRPAPLTLLLRSLTSFSRVPPVCLALLRDAGTVRLLTLLLQHQLSSLRRETLPLVANLLYGGVPGSGGVRECEDVVQRRDQLRVRLAPLLEKAHSEAFPLRQC